MGIPGLLKEIGKGERIALSKLSVEHLQKRKRPLRIAIDVAIWDFQNQAGQGGKNPALRTLYYRLLRLLALPIEPVFVYDGKNKPLTKRGKTVARYRGTSVSNEATKQLIHLFRFPSHVAPGEAEAECALLCKHGVVDAVLSQDVDAIMFGSGLTLRDWSHEGTRGNKAPTHVNALDLSAINSRSGLDPDGMILIALLSGGDYDEAGVPGFGAALACEIARAGFGKDLLDLIRDGDEPGVQEWRERLQVELETNESGYFRTKHKSLRIPTSFPDRTILTYYTNPATSDVDRLLVLCKQWEEVWNTSIDVVELREYVADTFDWQYKPGAWKLVRTLAPSLLSCLLRQQRCQTQIKSAAQITEKRQHFSTDGISELRINAVPVEVVGLDLEMEEDSPEYLAALNTEQDGDEAPMRDGDPENERTEAVSSSQQSPTKMRKSSPWNPYMLEKMWIPEAVVELGTPAIVEEWHQMQIDIRNDPLKFATRKCPKPKANTSKKGAQSTTLDSFLQPHQRLPINSLTRANPISKIVPVQSTDPRTEPSKSIKHIDHSVDTFFKPTKPSKPQLPVGDKRIRDTSSPIPNSHRANKSPRQSSAGHAFDSSIEITSSPVDSMETPLLLTPKHTAQARSTSNDSNIISVPLQENAHLSPSVTLRKKKNATALRSVQTSVPVISNPVRKRRSIESFFRRKIDSASLVNKEDDVSSVIPKPLDLSLPPESSTGLCVKLDLQKKLAQPRESLQGSWKEIADDDVFVTTTVHLPSRRLPRVSHVDLTGG